LVEDGPAMAMVLRNEPGIQIRQRFGRSHEEITFRNQSVGPTIEETAFHFQGKVW
jgi:hypothetical protein